MECKYRTVVNNHCVIVSSSENKECDDKLKQCRNNPNEYHAICDPVWFREPPNIYTRINSMNLDQLVYTRNAAINCIYARSKHQNECIDPRCSDSGHIGAINKMEKLVSLIDTRLNMISRNLSNYVFPPGGITDPKQYIDYFLFLNKLILKKMPGEGSILLILDLNKDNITLMGQGYDDYSAYVDLYTILRLRFPNF